MAQLPPRPEAEIGLPAVKKGVGQSGVFLGRADGDHEIPGRLRQGKVRRKRQQKMQAGALGAQARGDLDQGRGAGFAGGMCPYQLALGAADLLIGQAGGGPRRAAAPP